MTDIGEPPSGSGSDPWEGDFGDDDEEIRRWPRWVLAMAWLALLAMAVFVVLRVI